MWRRHGVDVAILPDTKGTPLWNERLKAIGCEVIPHGAQQLDTLDGIDGGIAASFCRTTFTHDQVELAKRNCRTIWFGCMCYTSLAEQNMYAVGRRFDVCIVDSDYQRECLMPELLAAGYTEKQIQKIPYPMPADECEFNPRPHVLGEAFVLGRLSRKHVDKWSEDTWALLRKIRHPIGFRCLGWSRGVEAKLGAPPEWAECMAAGTEEREEFYGSLHCMAQVNGGAVENRPCTGLEAMAYGVPVLAQNCWGWKEIIDHGRTGFLWNTPEDFGYYADRMAEDEDLRMTIIHEARRSVLEDVANEEVAWDQWRQLFASLT